MGKNKVKATIVVPKAKARNCYALHASMRKAGKMKSRAEKRQGTRAQQKARLIEAEE